MFEIKVMVEIPGLSEALNNLAHSIVNRVNVPLSPVAVSGTSAVSVVPLPHIEAPNQPVAPAAPVQATQVPAAPSAPAITMDEIARAGAALVDQGKMVDLINLLKNFGVPAITQLREDQLPGFAMGLRALGANI